MSQSLRLLPNLGGEEAGSWRQSLEQPIVASAARLWRLLFDERAQPVGDPPTVPAWPPALAEGRERAAFSWLEGLSGWVAWLGNGEAHRAAEDAGAALFGPSGEIVERVHDKAFGLRAAEALGWVPRPLRGTSSVLEPDSLRDVEALRGACRAARADWPDWARGRATLKPRMGTSGRGRVDPDDLDRDPGAAERVCARLAAAGGAILEPRLDRLADLSAQLRIDPDGDVVILGTLDLLVTPAGRWLGHRGEVDARGRVFSGHPRDEELREAGAAVAGAAAHAGYFGPAGVDALVFREPESARDLLRPVVELNARFTMGTVTVGLVRRCLPAVRREIGLAPGDRRAFRFAAEAPPGGWDGIPERLGEGTLLVPLGSSDAPVQPALLFAREAAAIHGLFPETA